MKFQKGDSEKQGLRKVETEPGFIGFMRPIQIPELRTSGAAVSGEALVRHTAASAKR